MFLLFRNWTILVWVSMTEHFKGHRKRTSIWIFTTTKTHLSCTVLLWNLWLSVHTGFILNVLSRNTYTLTHTLELHNVLILVLIVAAHQSTLPFVWPGRVCVCVAFLYVSMRTSVGLPFHVDLCVQYASVEGRRRLRVGLIHAAHPPLCSGTERPAMANTIRCCQTHSHGTNSTGHTTRMESSWDFFYVSYS